MHPYLKRIIILLSVIFILPEIITAQNRIILKDSTIIVGIIIEITDSLYVIQTEFGRLKIPGKRIDSIIFQQLDIDKHETKDSLKTHKEIYPLIEPEVSKKEKDVDKKLIYLPSSEIKRLKTKYILEGLGSQLWAISEATSYFHQRSKVIDLKNSFDYSSTSVIFVAGEINERRNPYFAIQIGALAGSFGSLWASWLIKLEETTKISSSIIGTLGNIFSLSGIFCWIMGMVTESKATDKLQSASSSIHAYRDREENLNYAGKKLSQSANWHLTSTILFEASAITYMIEAFTLSKKYSSDDFSLTFYIKTDPITGITTPAIKFTF